MVVQEAHFGRADNFSGACPEVAAKIRSQLQRDVQQPTSTASSSRRYTIGYLKNMAKYSLTLPEDSSLQDDRNVVDFVAMGSLKNSINWWSSPCPMYYPLHTAGKKGVEGLCDSVSMAAWGIEDCLLKDLMKKIFAVDAMSADPTLFKYWSSCAEVRVLSEQNRSRLWDSIIKLSGEGRRTEEPFHVFMLSNMLKRPIIVLGDGPVCGIYLPLLWPAGETLIAPLTIAYTGVFSPLVPNLPSIGRDFVPINKSNKEPLRIHCTGKTTLDNEKLLGTYMDVQFHPVMVDGGLRSLQVARLSLLSPPYDLDIIENYVDGMSSSSHVDMESAIVCDRWAQLAIGFPPMDWYAPKQIALYCYCKTGVPGDYIDIPEEPSSPKAVDIGAGSKSFFDKPVSKLTSKVKDLGNDQTNALMNKRAMFKRKATLSDMGPGFGGRRGAMVGGQTQEEIQNTAVGRMGGFNKPGVGRIRPVIRRMPMAIQEQREDIKEVAEGSETKKEKKEEDEEDLDPLSLKLKKAYPSPPKAPTEVPHADRRITFKKKLSFETYVTHS